MELPRGVRLNWLGRVLRLCVQGARAGRLNGARVVWIIPGDGSREVTEFPLEVCDRSSATVAESFWLKALSC